jgi:hypothetical protein
VGGQRIGILHGDPESLAGWRLALEAMEPGDPLAANSAGVARQPPPPTCWTGFIAPRSACSRAPIPACRTPST